MSTTTLDPQFLRTVVLMTGFRSTGADMKGYKHEMTDDQHRDLAAYLRTLTGMVIVSGYACDLYDKELYPDWQRVEFRALADGARERTEVLWLRNIPTDLFS